MNWHWLCNIVHVVRVEQLQTSRYFRMLGNIRKGGYADREQSVTTVELQRMYCITFATDSSDF